MNIELSSILAVVLAAFAALVIGYDLPTRTFVFLVTFWAFSPSVRIIKEIQ